MFVGNDLAKLYELRFDEKIKDKKKDVWKVLVNSFFQKYIKSSDTLIDLACGYGEFINNIHASKRIAIDLNPDSENFLESDIQFYRCDATSFSIVGKAIADIIFTSNFLEHLPDKRTLETVLEQAMFCLKPGGRLFILGPNLKYLPGSYWDYYDHHLGLTHLSLCEILKYKGFGIQSCIKKFLPYTIKGRFPAYPLLVWFYLKLPFSWKFLGKQFFIIASKPA